MKTIETPAPIANDSKLEQIDLSALDAVTGGCACGAACATGTAGAGRAAPLGGAAAQIPGLIGALGGLARR